MDALAAPRGAPRVEARCSVARARGKPTNEKGERAPRTSSFATELLQDWKESSYKRVAAGAGRADETFEDKEGQAPLASSRSTEEQRVKRGIF